MLAAAAVQTFDDQGRLIREEEDSDGDGLIDEVVRHVYQGLSQLVATDRGNNGSIDKRATLYHNEAGNLIRTEVDPNADGILDRVTQQTYVPSTAFQASERD